MSKGSSKVQRRFWPNTKITTCICFSQQMLPKERHKLVIRATSDDELVSGCYALNSQLSFNVSPTSNSQWAQETHSWKWKVICTTFRSNPKRSNLCNFLYLKSVNQEEGDYVVSHTRNGVFNKTTRQQQLVYPTYPGGINQLTGCHSNIKRHMQETGSRNMSRYSFFSPDWSKCKRVLIFNINSSWSVGVALTLAS